MQERETDGIKELQRALGEEILFLQSRKLRSTYTLYEGELVYRTLEDTDDNRTATAGYYRFNNEQLLNLAPDTGALFTLNSKTHHGFIQFCDRFGIEVTIEDVADPFIESVVIEVESWRLLDLQRTRLSKIRHNELVAMIEKEHEFPSPEEKEFVYGQDEAVYHVKANPISVIWGPPGTGKTYTLGRIAIDEMNAGRRVLILSQSNMAVDSAIYQIRKGLVERGVYQESMGKVLRYGMVKMKDLLQHRELPSWDAAFDSRPKLKEEYEQCSEAIRNAKDKSASHITALTSRRRKILDEISRIELDMISKARIVAMTATKATINRSAYTQSWDTVIFDEISMAYVSQIMIAASMANKKLVLIGDFKQLAPIVQNNNTQSLLREDFFHYANIVQQGKVRKHPWLTMLNEQRRMHPEIAKFTSDRIYEGKLRSYSGDSMAEKTAIANRGPFGSTPFVYVDYSGYQGTCFSTRHGSRFNLVSAIISIKIALRAIDCGQSDIGIITPYSAQSQIINAILRDIEHAEDRKLPIFCATVHQFQGSERDVIIFDSVENYPKHDAGRIVSRDIEDDSSMRLINVALTRTRGKFILVANHEYLRLRQASISQDMWEVIRVSRARCHVAGEEIRKLLNDKTAMKTIRTFDSLEQAVDSFRADMNKLTVKDDSHFIEIWHAPRNHFSHTGNYRFSTFMKEALTQPVRKRIFSSDAGVGAIVKATTPKLESKIKRLGLAPKDDFVIIDDTSGGQPDKILWLNYIPLYSNQEEGLRFPYSLTGTNISYQFRKLADLEYSIREGQTKQQNEKASKSSFSSFLFKKMDCGTPDCKMNKGVALAKSSKGKYYVKCAECGDLISPYIPNRLIEEYIQERNLKCQFCGGEVRISKAGQPYCTVNYKHTVGFSVNDIIEKEPDEIRKKK